MVGDGDRQELNAETGAVLATKRREYDEDDVRVRPGKSSRPRTRTRPQHTDAQNGFVIAVDRGRYTCVLAAAAPDAPTVTAMRARELGRKSVVVGDRVGLVGDTSGAPGALARIVRIEPRRSVLRRTAEDDASTAEGRLERVVVANADQLVIVSALADPPPRTGFIDRCLVAAYDADIEPLLCLTKADLAGPETVLDYYTELELPYVLIRPDSSLDALRSLLAGRVSVLVGHSGVGKSTLVNRLVPEAERAVGTVSAIGRGRHTSTSAVALRLPAVAGLPDDPGWIVDTPGVRSFGLAHVSAESLLHGFSDLVEATVDCPANCTHTADETECALAAWVADGRADPRRLASYHRLLASRAGETDPRGATNPRDEPEHDPRGRAE
ncbi:ribosome small subunit-dependent GTPase A [Micromonospora fiedleri]|uniref:Small ribosomal subunit biogenesis GTPase RsgA n=1 Tax=Micromonospora fiedleri TaxID=1157498 RepID=A0ABS1UML6_9ACTN|nr:MULTISPECIES: ribosome small subunit-dependent GTPase A [Micromonospora]MBL6277591.1 ribosome small subunit-dependent GTPase A [Micromonospora fiedleri]WSK42414.1 ribosome small subunit-dependent GTPase A [Micromonospora maris]